VSWKLQTRGEVPSVDAAAIGRLARGLPEWMREATGRLTVANAVGSFRAELELEVRGVRVVARGNSGDPLAAAAGAIAVAAERARTHGPWLLSAPEAARAPKPDVVPARKLRRLSEERAAIERELAGDGPFAFVDERSGALRVLARRDDGRLESLEIRGV